MASQSGWRIRQKAQREIHSAEKLAAPLEVGIRLLRESSDATVITVAEASGLLQRCAARLDPAVRWVYACEDLDDDDEGMMAQREARNSLFEKVKSGHTVLSYFAPIIKAVNANPVKDAGTYSAGTIKSALDDALDGQCEMPTWCYVKYAERCSKILLTEALDRHEAAWTGCNQNVLLKESWTPPAGAFDAWAQSLTATPTSSFGLPWCLSVTAPPTEERAEALYVEQRRAIAEGVSKAMCIKFSASDVEQEDQAENDQAQEPETDDECRIVDETDAVDDACTKYSILYLQSFFESCESVSFPSTGKDMAKSLKEWGLFVQGRHSKCE